MHESLIKERPFVRWHAAIFSRLAVEHEVRGDHSTTNDCGAIEELLSHAAGIGGRDLAARLYVGTTERLLEGISRFGEGSDGRNSLRGESRVFRRAVEGSSGDLSSFRKLFDTCGYGHRPTKDERHDKCRVRRVRGTCEYERMSSLRAMKEDSGRRGGFKKPTSTFKG